MNTHGFARITAAIIASLVWGSTQPRAQGDTPKTTVLSVLTLAKEDAEKAESESARIELRARVVHSIIGTGNEAGFPDYVAQARSALRARDDTYVPQEETLRFNWDVAKRAKRAFLLGDEREAREILRQCRPLLTGSYCGPSDTFVFDQEAFTQSVFLGWEVQAERLQAALDRLKMTAWPADFYQVLLIALGPRIAGADSGRRVKIQRLVRLSGVSITACLVDQGSFFLNDLAPRPKMSPAIGEIATLRKLACEGKVEAALERARSFENVHRRTQALAAIAEGLAEVPGFAWE